jgi:hypothetical protein
VARRVTARAVWATLIAVAACGGGHPETAPEIRSAPLPTAGLAGRPVTLYPLTLIGGEESLGWGAQLGSRAVALERADSLIAAYLTERNPEVQWILPDALRQAARRAPGLLPNPDHMATAMLRALKLVHVPDPLWSQLRALTGVAGDRYAAVPASLAFLRGPDGVGRAELSFVLVDVRSGLVGWRTVASGAGADPWSALRAALDTLAPLTP